jgi:hypothetical protein
VPAGLVCHVCPKNFLFQSLKPQPQKPRKKVRALVSREANWWNGSLGVGPTGIETARSREESETTWALLLLGFRI